jgi:hypothetical protein
VEGSEENIDPLRQEQERSPYSSSRHGSRSRNHRVLSRMRDGGRQRVIEEGREGEEG